MYKKWKLTILSDFVAEARWRAIYIHTGPLIHSPVNQKHYTITSAGGCKLPNKVTNEGPMYVCGGVQANTLT